MSFLDITVRHSADCPQRHRGPFYRGCGCWLHFRGSYNGKQYRIAAGTRIWEEAERLRPTREAEIEGGVPVVKEEPRPVTIANTIKTFVASKRQEGVSTAIVKKYETQLERLREFYAGLGRTVPAEITFDTLIAYRETRSTIYPSAATRHGVQQKLRGYLKYLHAAGHIERIPELSTIQVREPDNAEAFTDAEVEKILATIPGQFPDPEKAVRVRSFVLLMLNSGLRIGDTARIERAAITYDEANEVYQVRVTQKKTKHPVFVPIQSSVAKEILVDCNSHS